MATKTNKNLSPSCQSCSVKGCKIGLFIIQLLFTLIYAAVCYRSYAGAQIPGILLLSNFFLN